MKRFYLKITGRVQGVGYRCYTEDVAKRMNVTGWVRNMSDGRVEAEVQGDMKILEVFLLELRKGPILSRVNKIIQFEMVTCPKELLFEIRY